MPYRESGIRERGTCCAPCAAPIRGLTSLRSCDDPRFRLPLSPRRHSADSTWGYACAAPIRGLGRSVFVRPGAPGLAQAFSPVGAPQL